MDPSRIKFTIFYIITNDVITKYLGIIVPYIFSTKYTLFLRVDFSTNHLGHNLLQLTGSNTLKSLVKFGGSNPLS